jgi:hypothetical protein
MKSRSSAKVRGAWGPLAGLTIAAAVALLASAAMAGPLPFEDASGTSASALLSPELLRGPHHTVREQVESDGLIQTFTVECEFGAYPARGERMVRARIHEIETLVALRALGETEEFREAESNVPESPYVRRGSGWVVDSDASHAGLAPGALGAGWDSEPGAASGESPESDASWKLLAGFESRKRELAASLGVDPYTTNPDLQKALDRHAWVSYRSGAPPPAALQSNDAAADAEERAAVDERLRHFSSDDLERMNRLELMAMGVPEELREQFIANPSYSHKVETVLVESLAALEGTEDRVAFIEAAVRAASEDEAQSYGQLAKLMRSYSTQGGGLQRILQVEGQVAAYTSDGTLIVPVVSDHAVWSERVAGFAESVAKAAGESADAAKARFLFSGTISDRALEEIQSLGIDVTPNALERKADDTPVAP